jgi:hypothetical protein
MLFHELTYMTRTIHLLLAILCLTMSVVMAEQDRFSNGVIPDKETAVAVAEAILFRAYGKQNIESQKPYQVTLTDGEWYIFGSLQKDPAGGPVFGGVFRIVIAQKDGRVRSIAQGE